MAEDDKPKSKRKGSPSEKGGSDTRSASSEPTTTKTETPAVPAPTGPPTASGRAQQATPPGAASLAPPTSPPVPPATTSPEPAPAAAASAAFVVHAEPRRALRSNVISDAFHAFDDPKNSERIKRLGLPASSTEPTAVMVELNLHFASGLPGAKKRFDELWRQLLGDRPIVKISDSYFRCSLSLDEAENLAHEDQGGDTTRRPPRERSIYRIWPDFKIRSLIDRSVATVKADAALRAYGAAGAGIMWGVVDSGIDRNHPHFSGYDTLGGDAAQLHRDFTQPEIDADVPPDQRDARLQALIQGALTDDVGHGTHVAGIIAGGLAREGALQDKLAVRVAQTADTSKDQLLGLERRQIDDARSLCGVAPRARLVSLKVIGTGGGDTASNVLRALRYVRVDVNGEGKSQRIQGVNLSVGYEFDPRWFACGQSPICVEVNRLVQSGVVVVVAAGNTGYGQVTSREGSTGAGLTLTINDPGNAELAITVGATHRDSPHTYGVSYFSSKGPTGDGRLKPDLVAPGERVTSCAAGQEHLLAMKDLLSDVKPDEVPAPYIDDSGTSMAAPHVSGAAAAFLSIRREFIGRPEEVKRIFVENATSLGRERYFEGHGLVDLMRAIQSV
jgi:serine protease AprX